MWPLTELDFHISCISVGWGEFCIPTGCVDAIPVQEIVILNSRGAIKKLEMRKWQLASYQAALKFMPARRADLEC